MTSPIHFKKFTAQPLSRFPEKMLISWELLPNQADLSDFEFYIDRGEAQNQNPKINNINIDGTPWLPPKPLTDTINLSQLAGPISALDFYQYVDYTATFWDFYKNQYYQIRTRQISTQEEFLSPVFTMDGELDVVGIYIVDEVNWLLEDTTGEPTYVHKRKSTGVPCQNCFDPVIKKRLVSNCPHCYGTNWEGGFYPQLTAYVDYSPSTNVVQLQDWGATQPNEINAMLSNWPQLRPGDVLRELRTQKLWRVERISETEKRRIPLIQYIRCKEINPEDIEYKIPYDLNTALKVIEEFEVARQRREF